MKSTEIAELFPRSSEEFLWLHSEYNTEAARYPQIPEPLN